ncbi:hypothetical protein [Paracoccus sp. S4493]|uniref:hypothetical protein n=1 Tax=Paracoccus sp. S4493 TaxID=579490 RepID=UPI000A585DAF|nr:hypothetical protein [Paracoccus sp. S4493]
MAFKYPTVFSRKKTPKKRRHTPPFWVVLPLYLALFFKEEFYEYRLNLQRRYAREKRKGNRSASLYCRRVARDWWFAAGVRLVTFGLRLIPFAKMG